MEGGHRRTSCHPAALSNTVTACSSIPQQRSQQIERQFRHGSLTTLEAFPKLALPGPQSVPAPPCDRHLVIASGAVASGISQQHLRAGRFVCSQGQRPVLDDTLHDEGGAEALHAGEAGKTFVVELLESVQVGGDDAQEVVGFTEEPLGLPDVRDGGDGFFEVVDSVPVSAAHGDEDESLERQPESVGVEVCVVAADRAGAFQGAQAAVAGRDAEADSLGEFGDGQTTVLL
jgi:hypothetical protein